MMYLLATIILVVVAVSFYFMVSFANAKKVEMDRKRVAAEVLAAAFKRKLAVDRFHEVNSHFSLGGMICEFIAFIALLSFKICEFAVINIIIVCSWFVCVVFSFSQRYVDFGIVWELYIRIVQFIVFSIYDCRSVFGEIRDALIDVSHICGFLCGYLRLILINLIAVILGIF